ncbi:MAG: ASCH domain-containing protein [Bacteroidales bacterium]
MDTSTNVILSIKPKYAQSIIAGTKKVEFRKKIFKRPVDKVYIYSSSPTKKIIGYFTFSEIVEETPTELWAKFQSVGSIDKSDFFDYFKDTEKGFAIVVDNVEKFKKGIDPIEFFENFCAPQSYIYIEENLNT